MNKITLSPEQQRKFEMAIKIGILKELHRERMLTDMQLSQIITNIRKDTPAPDGGFEQAI